MLGPNRLSPISKFISVLLTSRVYSPIRLLWPVNVRMLYSSGFIGFYLLYMFIYLYMSFIKVYIRRVQPSKFYLTKTLIFAVIAEKVVKIMFIVFITYKYYSTTIFINCPFI